MNILSQIAVNKVLVIPIAAWFVAQALKTIVQALREKQLNPRYMFSAGGMPSAHSALVCALATTTGILYGVASDIFAISVILAAIVMYDATSVRYAVDKQSAILNHLLIEFPKTHLEFERFLQQLVGHTRFQVVVGAALGILLACWWS
ncbi:MAG TPA: divergent PAP2 family protein [Dehalococcoidia bacterium]|nr:divergent PAP2 family protein [Dehalococcoidia bacterium]